jgi:hypothetical protein
MYNSKLEDPQECLESRTIGANNDGEAQGDLLESSPRNEEVKWTDAQIRWTKEEGIPEKVEPDFLDPFADPDPTEVFSFRFKRREDNGDYCNAEEEKACWIELNIQGYKTYSDQVWHSTGLTLWKASKHLCDYMVKHAKELQGKRILEVSP